MKLNIKTYILILAIFTQTALAQHEGCNHGDAPSSDVSHAHKIIQIPHEAEHNINLKTEKASSRKIDTIITALGTAQNIPEQEAEVSSRIEGKVVELYVKPDSFVKKGAPIAKIESLLFGNPPPSTTLYAQISGIVESLNVSLGTPVSPNQSIAKIANTSKIYAVANVWESAIAKLKIGQTARIRFEAYPEKTYVGKLVKFASKVDSNTSTLGAYFEIDNPDGLIKQSMRASFAIVIDNKPVKVAINKNALLGGHGNYSAFVQVCPNDRIYERRNVVLGKSDDTYVEVLHGIHANEVVATNGAYQLQFMPPANEHKHEHAKETNEHKHEHKHSEKEHINDHKEEHQHSEGCGHSEKEHNKEHKHSDGFFSHIEIDSEYLHNLVYTILGASLLLNLIFILASFFGKRKDNAK
ncbi:MAG: efflux RND transporter periplasmic adaptor subunit [Opitutales bacterium]|nr:efflux RND transporter periplasmic adaptor subunit [Opitutales bacterium]